MLGSNFARDKLILYGVTMFDVGLFVAVQHLFYNNSGKQCLKKPKRYAGKSTTYSF